MLTKIAIYFATAVSIVACGGGSSTTTVSDSNVQNTASSDNVAASNNTQNINAPNNNTSNSDNTNSGSNTQTVLNYITSRHNSVVGGFLATEDSLSSTLAAQGKYQSGAHYSQSRDNYLAKIQSYLNDSEISYKTLNILLPVDRASVVSQLNTYKTADKNYASTYYSGVNWGLSANSLPAFIDGVHLQIDAAYGATISSLP